MHTAPYFLPCCLFPCEIHTDCIQLWLFGTIITHFLLAALIENDSSCSPLNSLLHRERVNESWQTLHPNSDVPPEKSALLLNGHVMSSRVVHGPQLRAITHSCLPGNCNRILPWSSVHWSFSFSVSHRVHLIF